MSSPAASKPWAGITLFGIVPLVLTIFVWPTTAAPGNEYGTGTWFNWVKTYSALAGCLGFMALRFVSWTGKDGQTHHLYEKKWALCFPPLILAINIAEAVLRDFQVFSFGLGRRHRREPVDHLRPLEHHERHRGHPQHHHYLRLAWHLCSPRQKLRDTIWPDTTWPASSPHDLWNFAYTYNCISRPFRLLRPGPSALLHHPHVLHQARCLAAAPCPNPGLWIMFIMTVPAVR